jgi:beta-glucosidase
MGVYHQPMRGLSKMTGGAVRWEELKGLLIMFNGKFFKGLGTYFKALKLRKQDRKEK